MPFWRSSLILNVWGIWGLTTILCNLLVRMTPSTDYFHKRKLLPLSLTDNFGPNTLPLKELGWVDREIKFLEIWGNFYTSWFDWINWFILPVVSMKMMRREISSWGDEEKGEEWASLKCREKRSKNTIQASLKLSCDRCERCTNL